MNTTTRTQLCTPLMIAAASTIGLTAANADFVGLTSDSVAIDQSGWEGSDARDLYLVSVYAEFDNAIDRLVAVYGSNSNATNLVVTTDDPAGFWQYDQNGGQVPGDYNISPDILAADVSLFGSAAYDSYLTIGLVGGAADNQLQEVGIEANSEWDSFNDGSGSLTVTDGALFTTPDDPQGVAGNYADNKVLVGQFAVGAGTNLNATFNMQWRDNANATQYSTAQNIEVAVEGGEADDQPNPASRYEDFNADWHGDLLYQHNVAGSLLCWVLGIDEDGDVTRTTKTIYSGNISSYSIASIRDLNGDGYTDFLWQRNTTGSLLIWYLGEDGDGNVTRLTKTLYSGNISSYSIVCVRDLDGDGDADVLWQHNTTGSLLVWYLGVDGDGNPTRTSKVLYDGNISSYSIVDVSDYDGDWDADILWQHNTSGALLLWYLGVDGDGEPTRVSDVLYSGNISSYSIVATNDYNGDGVSDILWQHNSTGSLLLWYLGIDGDGEPTRITKTLYSGNISSYTIVECDDINADGSVDLLWQHVTSGSLIA